MTTHHMVITSKITVVKDSITNINHTCKWTKSNRMMVEVDSGRTTQICLTPMSSLAELNSMMTRRTISTSQWTNQWEDMVAAIWAVRRTIRITVSEVVITAVATMTTAGMGRTW